MNKVKTDSEVHTDLDPLSSAQQNCHGVTRKDSIEKLIKQEKQVDQYIENGRKELALKLLYDLIITYAKAKDFTKAESLRERLIHIDSMALSKIVNSAEIIEQEKSEIIDARQRGLWKQLYSLLTTEEGNAFYFAVKKLSLGPDKAIIKQGKLNDKLFFIDKGTLKLICQQGEEEHFIKQINMGETVGGDTFFSISVCTTSVITKNCVQLSYLDRFTLQKLGEKFYGLENKLQDFSFKSGEKIEDLLKKKGIERRRFKRYKATGTIDTQFIDKNGTLVGRPIQGLLEDVCEGGVSCFIKCSNKSSARLLLGRPVQIKMSFLKDGSHMTVTTNGLIVGAKCRFFNDYTMNVRFSNLFPEAQIREWIVFSS